MLLHSFMCVMTHLYETWLNCVNPCYTTQTNAMCFFICCMTHSCVSWLFHMRHDSFTIASINATRRKPMRCALLTRCMTQSHVTCLIHMWFNVCVTWLNELDHVWHDSFKYDVTHSCVTWLNHMCDITHSYVWYGSFTCTCVCVWHDSIICDMTHSYVT